MTTPTPIPPDHNNGRPRGVYRTEDFENVRSFSVQGGNGKMGCSLLAMPAMIGGCTSYNILAPSEGLFFGFLESVAIGMAFFYGAKILIAWGVRRMLTRLARRFTENTFPTNQTMHEYDPQEDAGRITIEMPDHLDPPRPPPKKRTRKKKAE